MELDSPQFWVIFIVSVLFLIRRTRKKGPKSPEKPKGVSGLTQVLYSPLTINTPLPCLLDDSKRFGVLFQEKDIPELPHRSDCSCQVLE